MRMKTRLLCAVLISAAALASRLNATEIVTTSYSAWKATQTGTPTEWNIAFSGGGSYNTAAGYSLTVGSYGPIAVTGPDGAGYNLNELIYGTASNQTLAGASDGVGTMVFNTPAAGLTAFLFGLGETGNASPIAITLSDGEAFNVNPTVNGNVFFGLSSATAITSFTLSTASGSAVVLTDFYAGASNQQGAPPAPAAEVATILMIGTGLLVIGALRRVSSNFSRSQASAKPA